MCRFAAMSTIEKCKIRRQNSVGLDHVTYVEFWDPLDISGMAEATAFKCGVQIDCKD